MNHWTLPCYLTLFRGLLILPLVVLLSDPSPIVLGLVVVIWGLDLVDGAWARHRNETTPFGATMDSAVDKLSFLIVFVALMVYGLIPFWLFVWIATMQALQLLILLIVFRNRKDRPVTGMMFISGLSLGLSLFMSGSFQEILYWLAALASLNHLFYYSRPLLRRWRRSRVLSLTFFSRLPGLGGYFDAKMKQRAASFHAPLRFLTWANGVTCVRLFIGGLLLDELWSQHWMVAGMLGALFLILDVADGALARATQTVSLVGKALELVGDKVVILGVVTILTLQGFFSVSVLAVVLVRYGVIGICAFLLFFIFKKPLPIAVWSHLANIAFFLTLVIPSPWWITLVILLQLQQLLQYYHDSYRLMDNHHAYV